MKHFVIQKLSTGELLVRSLNLEGVEWWSENPEDALRFTMRRARAYLRYAALREKYGEYPAGYWPPVADLRIAKLVVEVIGVS